MKKEFEQYITHHTEQALGVVHKHLINSALVSAQNRNRYYWTNIDGVIQPEDKGILLADVLEDAATDRDKSYCIDANYHKGASVEQYESKCRRQLVVGAAIRGRYIPRDSGQEDKRLTEQRLETREDGKTNALTTVQKDNVVVRRKSKCVRSGGLGSYDRHEWDSISDCHYRKLTPLECERLQTLPDNYTAHVSNTQRYKMIGNGWTVDVIAHILSFIPRIKENTDDE
jgi:site-specific DNA-cytosine methylase